MLDTKFPSLLVHGIARRVIVAVVLFSSLITLIITAYQLYRDYKHDLVFIDTQLEQIQNVHVPSVADSLWAVDQKNLQILVEGISKLPNMQYLEIRDNDKVWVSTGSDRKESVVSRQYALTHMYLGEVVEIGTLTVVANLDEVYQRLFDKTVVILIGNAIKTFLVAGFILLLLHFLITRHLLHIVRYLGDNEIDKMATPLKLNRKRADNKRVDELDLLTNEFNLMRQNLRRSFNSLKRSEERFYQLADNIDQVFCLVTPDWDQFFYVSPAYEKSWGFNAEDLYNNHQLWIEAIHPDDQSHFSADIKKNTENIDGFIEFREFRIRKRDGDILWIKAHAYPITDRDGEVIRFACIAKDVTRQKGAEESLRRSQKMDAIGQMAGGIAHDFNNILGVIIGNMDLLKREVTLGEKALKRIEATNKAARRAANLTRQLLGFSRDEVHHVHSVDINQVIRGMDNLICRSVTPEVEVDYSFVDEIWLTEIDDSDFEDALLNLVINARDAMSGGGRLTLETANKVLGDEYAKTEPSVKPGKYIELAINDTGKGIPREDIDRIFEPFYTTKPRDKGTGLGMSMVFGFVQRSNGHIKVYSEQGIGTTIRCYLPRSITQSETQVLPTLGEQQLPRGQEMVLAVDDEEDLLLLAQQYLEALGYSVITAANGQQALNILKERSDIDLLFSDIVMPGGMNGYELAEQASTLYPTLKVLLTSGYSSKTLSRNGQAQFEATMLSKPYNHHEIATRVRQVLEN